MYEIDGVQFVNSWTVESTPERFAILKDDHYRDLYLDQLNRHRGGRIVELGIYRGGSTALAMLAVEPETLLALDMSEPLEALETFKERRGLGDRLLTHYGVDQGDRETLVRLLDESFGDAEIDLVIDDASHLFEESLASFEVIFPRMRKGGEYILEDWPIGPGIVAGIIEMLSDDDALDDAITGGHPVFNLNNDLPPSVQRPAGHILHRALEGGGQSADRARRLMDHSPCTFEETSSITLAALVALLAGAVASRPGEIESFHVETNHITIVRGQAELPREGWTLERHPGHAVELLGMRCGLAVVDPPVLDAAAHVGASGDLPSLRTRSGSG